MKDRTFGAAKRLPRDMTDVERNHWSRLRSRQLTNLKFRRQALVDRYIVDFLCHELKLIIELDSGQHADPANVERDEHRTQALEKLGYTVLGFWNYAVLTNMEGVLETVLRASDKGTTLALDYTARHFRRRTFTIDGARVTIDLPEARLFADGDIIEATDGTSITIRAAEEDLLEVTGAALPRIAWHIGNRHTPCQVEDARLLIKRDHVLQDMLIKLGATVRDVCEPFQPEGGAYGHGRTHGHSHSHDPQEDPDSHLRKDTV